jgi:hypothetical protein
MQHDLILQKMVCHVTVNCSSELQSGCHLHNSTLLRYERNELGNYTYHDPYDKSWTSSVSLTLFSNTSPHHTLKTLPFIPVGATYKLLLPTESVIKLQACMYATYQCHNHLNYLCQVHARVRVHVCVCVCVRARTR